MGVGGRTRVVLGAVAAAALIAQLPATASPQPDPALWLIGADGSNAHEVDTNVERGWGYDWSPDGAFLAYAALAAGFGPADIWVLDVGTGQRVNVTTTPDSGEFMPSWSPDGTRIVFTRDGDVWAMDADGGDAAPLTQGEAFDTSPEWAPVGDLVAYERLVEDGATWTLNVVGAGGGPSLALADVSDELFTKSWSPDGREIAYVSPSEELRVVDVATGATAPLAADAYAPSWAPSGDRIAFGSSGDLWVVARGDGSTAQVVDGGAPLYSKFSWSPDARQIAFDGVGLSVVDVATGSYVTLTRGQPTTDEHSPLWSPAGDLIAYVGIDWCCALVRWDRRVGARATRHLVVRGRVRSDSPSCVERVPVNVKTWGNGAWVTRVQTVTGGEGRFRARLVDRPGRYRIVTPRVEVFEAHLMSVCRKAVFLLRHRHRRSARA